MSNPNVVLVVTPTPYGTARLWFRPEVKEFFIPHSIWGGIDGEDEENGTVSVETTISKAERIGFFVPGFLYTRDRNVAKTLWGVK